MHAPSGAQHLGGGGMTPPLHFCKIFQKASPLALKYWRGMQLTKCSVSLDLGWTYLKWCLVALVLVCGKLDLDMVNVVHLWFLTFLQFWRNGKWDHRHTSTIRLDKQRTPIFVHLDRMSDAFLSTTGNLMSKIKSAAFLQNIVKHSLAYVCRVKTIRRSFWVNVLKINLLSPE